MDQLIAWAPSHLLDDLRDSVIALHETDAEEATSE